jgi:hypothetical protein
MFVRILYLIDETEGDADQTETEVDDGYDEDIPLG